MKKIRLIILLFILGERKHGINENTLYLLIGTFLTKREQASFNEEIKDLSEKGLIKKEDWGSFTITEAGVKALKKDQLISLAREAKLD